MRLTTDIYASKAAYETAGKFQHCVENDALIWVESGVSCKNVLVESVFRNETCEQTNAPILRISEDAVVENFKFVNCYESYCNGKYKTIENNTDFAICE